jgi:S-adenosylhomocysteine hydrolase
LTSISPAHNGNQQINDAVLEGLPQLVGRKILVIGLGMSGEAAAALCASRGADVTVTDPKGADELNDVHRRLSVYGRRYPTFSAST